MGLPAPAPRREHPGVVVIEFGGQEIARSSSARRVLETSHPPVFYVPLADFAPDALRPVEGTTWCEYKGAASYYDVVAGTARAERAAWTYLQPTPGYESLAGAVAVYPGRMDRCLVDGEEVQAQPGDFYGGWITSRVVGPFKGPPGTRGW